MYNRKYVLDKTKIYNYKNISELINFVSQGLTAFKLPWRPFLGCPQ